MLPKPKVYPAAVRAVPKIPVASFIASLDCNVALLDKRGTIVAVNDAWSRFGRDNGAIPRSIGVGVNYFDVCRRSADAGTPTARLVLEGLLSVLRGSTAKFRWEYRCDAPGTERWYQLTATRWYLPEGGLFVSHRDISEFRLTEEVQRRTLNAVRAIVWAAEAPTFRTTFLYGQVEEILGFPLRAWLNDPDLWKNRLHPDDRDWVLRYSSEQVAAGRVHEFDYRLLAADGHTVWLHQLVNVNVENGKPARLVGVATDVSEIHRAHETLRHLSGHLLQAQEQERARIARELHDDINQRLALVAMDLDRVTLNVQLSADELRSSIAEAKKQVFQLASDIHEMSHRLHSSKLNSRGLTAAAEGFCRELMARQDLEIDFCAEGIPKHVPEGISLCLFRVLQEALQNATKHSGIKRFQVSLAGSTDQIILAVRDEGRGFHPGKGLEGSGFGLTSMEERLKLVGGKLHIDARPGRGTTIRASVPLHHSTQQMQTVFASKSG